MSRLSMCHDVAFEKTRSLGQDSDRSGSSDTSGDSYPTLLTDCNTVMGPIPVLCLYRRFLVCSESPSWASYLPAELQLALAKGEYCQDAMVAMSHMSHMSTTSSCGDGPPRTAHSVHGSGPPPPILAAALAKLSPQRLQAGEPSSGLVWTLSRTQKGCRDVQKCLETAVEEKERVALALELRGHVWEALRCPHANYVLQKVICLLKPSDIQFVVDEVAGKGSRAVCHAARHKYGCRILQRLLEHCTAAQVRNLVNALLSDPVVTAMHPYGNYVMQHLIEYGSVEQQAALTKALVERIEEVGRDEYACAVLSKAMLHGEEEDRVVWAGATDKRAAASDIDSPPLSISLASAAQYGMLSPWPRSCTCYANDVERTGAARCAKPGQVASDCAP
eukprot:TRINITY_DN67757_c0_g1_i6.p1 TRINITY_DN67757_c0_g1~~TRINITY_DN67757_c0_g1_i6.p1  ORF type:complete len:390 (-),score=44.38 TRINITY_DN67757_c0_g1_i6:279-1448(-)